MLNILVVVLVALWLTGYIDINNLTIPFFVLFTVNNHQITLRDFLIFIVIGWIIGILPSPFREVGSILLVLYLLSSLGIIAVAGLSNILVVVIIVGLILYILRGVF